VQLVAKTKAITHAAAAMSLSFMRFTILIFLLVRLCKLYAKSCGGLDICEDYRTVLAGEDTADSQESS